MYNNDMTTTRNNSYVGYYIPATTGSKAIPTILQVVYTYYTQT